ncbi:Arc family DNA-binding protein [Burkholderia multivorans]|uniref:Arc family DNA-binding protein n=1 Tax=Burkholderia cepacia complex TaxID=87882 RepID=UPI000CFEC99B|nr:MULTISPECIES: Arc family DNA-binding protein [Burkholderia cepacia complex]MBU9184374.1 Arc family DNA-binding protein [Burkholderia multivorans]MBU9438700.1 Arc family DNA-binding protein [Burkholderia multivorans]MBU9598362.1 Arc family DNA-binding protein [Burkholderia multivorans]MCA8485014.1 Arc family DNA-binding protein [Burkholderia multivorans]MDN7451336.1 Arc family DNA-binding protein [Burkholderia multivorans]
MATKQPTSYPLRMPEDLRERIEAVAQESGRSVNQEIVQRLSDSFQSGRSLPKSVTEVIEKASETSGRPFDDLLLRYIVVGMQADPLKTAADAALMAERHRGAAMEQLLLRTADALHHLAEKVTSIEFTPEVRGEWQQKFSMLTHDILRLARR